MQKKPVVYAWIFARGGSKGLPRKNVMPLDGKPLIAYAIETGLQSELIDKVFVSTDDSEIADVAREYGADVPFVRPDALAEDHSPERLAWRHAVEWVKTSGLPAMDVMVSLPPTAPLRTVAEVDRGINQFTAGGWDTVISVSKSNRHPSFNVVHVNGAGAVQLVMPLENKAARRQDFDPVYDIATAFYVTSPGFVLRTDSFWDGRVGAVEIPAAHAVDIDDALDFEFAEFLLRKQRGSNEKS
jgi:CMP-N-acetylneuraminic acid synthetase